MGKVAALTMQRKQRLFAFNQQRRQQSIWLEATPFAAGGDANIYHLVGDNSQVAKIWHNPKAIDHRLEKLKAMLTYVPDLQPISFRDKTYTQLAWPTAWLENDVHQCVGYLMPFLDTEQTVPLEALLAAKTRKAYQLPEPYGYRVTAAYNVATAVAALHEQGHYIIDLKPINISLHKDTLFSAILDCDGFSIYAPAGRIPAHQYTDGYIAPEALQQRIPPELLEENQDRFALAVVLFQLLNQGLHPFQGVPERRHAYSVPISDSERAEKGLYAYGLIKHEKISPSPWSIHEYLELSTRQLFDRAFTSPNNRPSAHEWHEHLVPFVDRNSKRLKPCSRNNKHWHFTPGCGFCALEQRQEQKNNPHIGSTLHSNPAATQKTTAAYARAVAAHTQPEALAQNRIVTPIVSPVTIQGQNIASPTVQQQINNQKIKRITKPVVATSNPLPIAPKSNTTQKRTAHSREPRWYQRWLYWLLRES